VILANQTGAFGGGLNDRLASFESRNALSAQLYWEVKNLGLGNRTETMERRAIAEQTQYALQETQARIAADVVETAYQTAAKQETLALAEESVKAANELYRINKEGTFNVIDAKNLFDALRPLQAIQLLNQSRQAYLAAVVDFNKTQFKLFQAIGYPPSLAAGSTGK
jgi:outer membrane protein TolC